MPDEKQDVGVEKLSGSIFVSHSHKDIEKVREIRNYLESLGIEPILLYLRCMDHLNFITRLRLTSLIFREIEARDWFLYLDSQNARASRWVQNELYYALRSKGDNVLKINLDDSIDKVRARLAAIAKSMRVYVDVDGNFSVRRMVWEEFEKQDFHVIRNQDKVEIDDETRENELRPSYYGIDQIDSVIRNGCFVPVFILRSISSIVLNNLLEYAYSIPDASVLPIVSRKSWNELCATEPDTDYHKMIYRTRKNLVNREVIFIDELNRRNVANAVTQIRKELIRRINSNK